MTREIPFDRVIESLPDGVVLLDTRGLIQYMNPIAERITESSLKEAYGKHWKDVFSLKVEDPVSDQTGSLTEILHEHPILITKSGKGVPIELQISPLVAEGDSEFGSVLVLHDVSDFHLELEGLKDSRAKYKRLVNAIEGIVWEAEGEAMKFRFVSDFAEKLLGHSPRKWIHDSEFWKSIIHADDRNSVLEVIAQSIRQKEDYQIEYRVITADRRTLLVRDSATLIMQGDSVRLSGVMTDITDSKRARDELIKSEERFAAAFYANPAALLLVSRSGAILEANDSFERTTGFFREEVLQRTLIQAGLLNSQQFEKLLRTIDEFRGNAEVNVATRNGLLPASFRQIRMSGDRCMLASFQPPVAS